MLGFEKSVKSSMSKSDQGPLKPREKWSVGCRKKFWDLVIFQKKNFFLSPKKFQWNSKNQKCSGTSQDPENDEKTIPEKMQKKIFLGGPRPFLGVNMPPAPQFYFSVGVFFACYNRAKRQPRILFPLPTPARETWPVFGYETGARKIFFARATPILKGYLAPIPNV